MVRIREWIQDKKTNHQKKISQESGDEQEFNSYWITNDIVDEKTLLNERLDFFSMFLDEDTENIQKFFTDRPDHFPNLSQKNIELDKVSELVEYYREDHKSYFGKNFRYEWGKSFLQYFLSIMLASIIGPILEYIAYNLSGYSIISYAYSYYSLNLLVSTILTTIAVNIAFLLISIFITVVAIKIKIGFYYKFPEESHRTVLCICIILISLISMPFSLIYLILYYNFIPNLPSFILIGILGFLICLLALNMAIIRKPTFYIYTLWIVALINHLSDKTTPYFLYYSSNWLSMWSEMILRSRLELKEKLESLTHIDLIDENFTGDGVQAKAHLAYLSKINNCLDDIMSAEEATTTKYNRVAEKFSWKEQVKIGKLSIKVYIINASIPPF